MQEEVENRTVNLMISQPLHIQPAIGHHLQAVVAAPALDLVPALGLLHDLEEQRSFLEAMDYAQAAPSLSQAQHMRWILFIGS
mgnify:CR=1 FL=1